MNIAKVLMIIRKIIFSILLLAFQIAAEVDLREYFPSKPGTTWSYHVDFNYGVPGSVDAKITASEKIDSFNYERIKQASGTNSAGNGEFKDTCSLQGKYYCSSDVNRNPEGANYSNEYGSAYDVFIPFSFEGGKFVKLESSAFRIHDGGSIIRIAKRHVGVVYQKQSTLLISSGFRSEWILTEFNGAPIDTLQIRRLVKASNTLFIETWISNHSTGGSFMTGANRGRNLLGRDIPISGRHPEIVGGSLKFPR